MLRRYALTALFALSMGAASAQAVRVQSYTFKPRSQHRLGAWRNSATDSVRIYWGGFSGLRAVPGAPGEFYTVTDRGPNVDAPGGGKFFPLPNFAPTIIRFRVQADSIVPLAFTSLKTPAGVPTSGRPLPTGFGSTGETACATPNCAGAGYALDPFGIDSEGIELDGSGGFWLCEEYGTSVWHVAADGHLLNRYSPWGNHPAHAPQDVAVDSVFRRRIANKGFEGICRTPNGKIYAFIQSPLGNPTEAVAQTSRVHRILEIDPATNATRTFFYFHKAAPSGLSNDKIYIGDAAAINNNELLVLEHGGKGANTATSIRNRKLVVKIDLRGATPLPQNAVLAAETLDSTGLAQRGYVGVQKTLVLDLLQNGYDPSLGKAEGLAIVNDSTIAVANDNDFAVDAAPAYDRLVGTGLLTKLYVFTLPRARHLALAARPTAAALAWNIYPNPVPNGQPLHLPRSAAYKVLDNTGRRVRRGQGAEVPTAGLPAGLYLLRDGAGRPAGRFVVE